MGPIGVYVHFPWCLKKCPYCDFVSFARGQEEIDHEGYADAVIAELEGRRCALAGRPLASVFFGGGTPSLWEPRALGRVLDAVLKAADAGATTAGARVEVEVTVECNPTSLDEARARALVDVGVNRLSIGVQGLDPERLRFLGRLHDAGGGIEAVEAALRAGVPRVSADLIYGVATHKGAPGAEETVAEALRLVATGITHLSAYSLTIEPGTQFGELARRGRLPIAPDDGVAETFFALDAALEAEGLSHYEISNYARPGAESIHNLGYWRGQDYLGLGCAAFGTLGRADGSALRYRNITDPARYVERARACGGSELLESDEALDPETRLRERIMLGLRLCDGIDLEAAAAELGVPAWSAERRRAADRLISAGRLTREGSRLCVPPAARVYADGIAAALF
jgi:putative oxygen-independent coproporphyrinogen III oxidase